MTSTTIRVTNIHIDVGVYRSPNRCPIALALIDAGYTAPYVGGGRMTVLGDETLPEAYWLPKILRDWTVVSLIGTVIQPNSL